jgi:hypothetical protein
MRHPHLAIFSQSRRRMHYGSELCTGGTRGWPAGAMATPNTVKKFKYLINISILKHKNYHFTYFL